MVEDIKKEAMLLSEYTAILEWIRDTVKSDAGGQIPLGICYVDSANIASNFADGDIVGTALGIPIVREAILANGAYKFVDFGGTTISEYP